MKLNNYQMMRSMNEKIWEIIIESLEENWVLKISEEIKNQGHKLEIVVEDKKVVEKQDVIKACQFEQHLENQGLEKSPPCDLCGKKCHLKLRLRKHMQSRVVRSWKGGYKYWLWRKWLSLVQWYFQLFRRTQWAFKDKPSHQERYQKVFEEAFFYHTKKLVETKWLSQCVSETRQWSRLKPNLLCC